MAPLLTLPNAGMRATSTISRAASSTLHSSASVGQPVVSAPKKSQGFLLRPALASSSHSRRRTRTSAHQAVPILSLDRPEPEEQLLSNALPLATDLPALPLWPTPEEADASTPADATNSLSVVPEDAVSAPSVLAAAAATPVAAADTTEAASPHPEAAAAPTPVLVAEEARTPLSIEQQEGQQQQVVPQAQDGHADAAQHVLCSTAQKDDQHEGAISAATAAAPEAQGLHAEDSTASQLHACQEQQQDSTPVPVADERFGQQWVHAQPFYPQQQQLAYQPQYHAAEQAYGGYAAVPYTPNSACSVSGTSHMSASFHKDQNSVTIKADTKVKDAAGAIAKVLDRLCSTLVTALQPPSAYLAPHHHHHAPHHHASYNGHSEGHAQAHHGAGGGGLNPHEALNRAVKALAVCRKYITDASAPNSGVELGFLPVNRSDAWGRVDPSLFSFLAFKSIVQPGYGPAAQEQQQQQAAKEQPAAEQAAMAAAALEASPAGSSAGDASATLAQQQQPELHVSSNSDPATVASNLVRVVLEQGQAVMKAGGGNALFVAMTAVVQARAWLKGWHAMDILLVPQWITEDTRATLGRESKFVQFNVLPSGLHGVLGTAEHGWTPAIVPIAPASSSSSVAFA